MIHWLLSLLLGLGSVGAALANPAPFVPPPAPTRGAYQNDIVYYIVVDRFSDGEPANNIPLYAFEGRPEDNSAVRRWKALNRAVLPMMFDPSRSYLGLYFGGDLQGVIDRLDYLADLGVTKIVLTPIMDNANGFYRDNSVSYFLHRSRGGPIPQPDYARIMTAYHGYWIRDWYTIDEHFRNPSDEPYDHFAVLRTLLDEAGRRGIGILLDITLNHSTPLEGVWVDEGSVYAGANRVGPYSPSVTRSKDFGWFHRYFPIDFTNPTKQELENGYLPGGMPDLDQSFPETARYLLGAALFWLRFNEGGTQISGFRVDAIKHVPLNFWRTFEDAVVSVNPNAILMGEVFEGGFFNRDSLEFVDKTNYFSQYDFSLSRSAAQFFAGDRSWFGRGYVLRQLLLAPASSSGSDSLWNRVLNPANVLQVDRQDLKRISAPDAAQWGLFLDNHDLPRLRTVYPKMSDEAYISALMFIIAAPRVPLLLYGVETGLAVPNDPRSRGLFGRGGDPFSRPMMVFPGDPGWNSEIYSALKSLIAIRKTKPVLRYGETTLLEPKGSSAIDDLFFSRSGMNGESPVIFAYSTRGGTFKVPAPRFSQAQDALTGERLPVSDGFVTVSLAPHRSRLILP